MLPFETSWYFTIYVRDLAIMATSNFFCGQINVNCNFQGPHKYPILKFEYWTVLHIYCYSETFFEQVMEVETILRKLKWHKKFLENNHQSMRTEWIIIPFNILSTLFWYSSNNLNNFTLTHEVFVWDNLK